ncbi:hypothetical protein [Kitasatospora sp. NBC_01302]|uniref:hypothetical protein n=1 Tax=Kitasatospora sp. NBC_01302 TaxID=2903575 RepID=UPI002E1228B4|nr:hypothetical protein OG294_34565 [Kitasatospora sp. NBC_01302]
MQAALGQAQERPVGQLAGQGVGQDGAAVLQRGGDLGAVFATASVGGLIGALISRKVIARFPLGRVYLVAQAALLLGPALIPAATGPRPVMTGIFVLSFFTTYLGLGVAGVVIVSLRQAVTPQSMMGRMTAAFRTLLFGGGALGGLSCGPPDAPGQALKPDRRIGAGLRAARPGVRRSARTGASSRCPRGR